MGQKAVPGGPGCRFRSEATWVAPVLSLGMGGGGAAGQRNTRLVRTAPREAGGPTVCVARGPWGVGDGRVVWAGLVPGKNRLGREGEDERGTAPGRTSAGGLGGEEAADGGRGQAGLRLGSQLLLGSPAASTRQLRHGDH